MVLAGEIVHPAAAPDRQRAGPVLFFSVTDLSGFLYAVWKCYETGNGGAGLDIGSTDDCRQVH